ncbi:MAG: sialidase family protein [Syntrophomonadaceae bacterium]|nr:sialidase family protein [Syntrophomonadaceae bacterium]
MKSINFKKLILPVLFISLFVNISYAVDKKTHLDPPGIVKNPATTVEYSPGKRKFTGISSLAVSQEGRLWAVWYTGITPAEDANNYVVVATSGDKGETWEEVLAIDPDGPGPVRAFDPEVWLAPDGKLWVFWAQQVQPARSTNCGVWAISTTNSGSNNPEWSEPVRLTDGVMMCKPVVLSTGEWALPVSFWHLWEGSAKIVASDDNGQTWSVRGGVNVPREVRNHDEHMIVERKDGSLWMLVRTKYGVGESVSHDRGRSWSPLVPSKIQHPAARLFIYRLNSGNLLLVKHGPVDLKTQRSHLFAFISKDDGHTWSDGLLLDERSGVSYPDGQQFSDGTVYLTYDFSRTKDQNIMMTSFTEEDIKSTSARKIVEVYQNRRVISSGGVKISDR